MTKHRTLVTKKRNASVATLPMVFGFIPQSRSTSLQDQRSALRESSVIVRNIDTRKLLNTCIEVYLLNTQGQQRIDPTGFPGWPKRGQESSYKQDHDYCAQNYRAVRGHSEYERTDPFGGYES
jgi:hypothetical protein